MKALLKILSVAAIVFTFCHASILLLAFFNYSLFQQILYHYSDELIWYLIFFILPVTLGLSVGFVMMRKRIWPGIIILGCLVLIAQVTIHIIEVSKSKEYWGYYFKRPTIFKEVKDARAIETISVVSTFGTNTLHKGLDSSLNLDYYREDPYYATATRALMTFEDVSSDRLFSDWKTILADSLKKISDEKLQPISSFLFSSDFTVKKSEHYETAESFSGYIIEFKTAPDRAWTYVGVGTPQVDNDHYAFYEMLYRRDKNSMVLADSQKFFWDFAGYEGQEYSLIGPVMSLVILIPTALTLIVFLIIYLVKKKRAPAQQL